MSIMISFTFFFFFCFKSSLASFLISFRKCIVPYLLDNKSVYRMKLIAQEYIQNETDLMECSFGQKKILVGVLKKTSER